MEAERAGLRWAKEGAPGEEIMEILLQKRDDDEGTLANPKPQRIVMAGRHRFTE